MAIAEEGAALNLVPPTVTVAPIATADYPTPARRPAYSVLDKSSLARYGLVPEHWRRRLRAVLGEMQSGQDVGYRWRGLPRLELRALLAA